MAKEKPNKFVGDDEEAEAIVRQMQGGKDKEEKGKVEPPKIPPSPIKDNHD